MSTSTMATALGHSSWRPVSATVAGGAILAVALFRRHYLRWGATEAERTSDLPGDDLLPAVDLVATRAIATSAAPEQLWPWIAQLGRGRGGFYSYDFLENLVGCDMHSATRIHPELASCLMSVRMLRGIKQRAEHGSPQRVQPSVEHRYRPQPGSYAELDQQADEIADVGPATSG